jgi:hypothetical protein
MIKLDNMYKTDYDKIKEIFKALTLINEAKSNTVNLGSKKRTNIVLAFFKRNGNFVIRKKGENRIFISGLTKEKINTFVEPILIQYDDLYKKEFSKIYFFIINYNSSNLKEYRINFIKSLVSTKYDINNVDIYNLTHLNILHSISILIDQIDKAKFPIIIKDLLSSITYPIINNLFEKRLLLFNIIHTNQSKKSDDEIIVNEYYNLLIENLEPRFRKFVAEKILFMDNRPLTDIFQTRFPKGVREDIKDIFINNKKKEYMKSEVDKKGKSEFEFNNLFSDRKNLKILLNSCFLSSLGEIIIFKPNWGIFSSLFSKYNISKPDFTQSKYELNLVRNNLAHIIKDDLGRHLFIIEVNKKHISLSDCLNFCFLLDEIFN